LVTNAGGSLDGDNNGSAGGDFVRGDSLAADAIDKFFRRFGDTNGNRVTSGSELTQLRQAINATSPNPPYDARFDFNSNGVVSGSELTALRQRINITLNF